MKIGTSLAIQWLGPQTFTAKGRVQSLVGELRACKLHSITKKTKQNKTKTKT